MPHNEVNSYNDYSVASREENPLISNMSFLHKPQIGAEMFDVNPLESDLGDFIRMGLMREVKGEEIIHHEANKRYTAVSTNTSATSGDVYGVASGAGADPALYDGLDYIQLSAASHSPSTGTNANKYSYPRVGNSIEFKNGGVWRIAGKRETVAGEHRLYITKIQASMPSLAATITNAGGTFGNDKFSVYGYSFEEATSGMLKGLVPTTKTFTNTLQSFYDFYSVTDFAERDETYALKWHNKVINFNYVKGLDDTEQRFLFNETFSLFLTPKDDGNLVSYDAEGGQHPVGTTQGYIPNLKLNAAKLYYDNNPTIALFEQILRLRRKLNQGSKSLVHMGFEFEYRAKDIISEFGTNGSLVYNRQSVDLNISQIKIGGCELNMKPLQILNQPEVTAIDGFDYPWMFIIAPMDKTKDSKTNIMKDAFSIIYKKMVGRGARGHYKIWETGGNSAAGTDKQLIRNINIASRKGTQVVGASRHILGRRA